MHHAFASTIRTGEDAVFRLITGEKLTAYVLNTDFNAIVHVREKHGTETLLAIEHIVSIEQTKP